MNHCFPGYIFPDAMDEHKFRHLNCLKKISRCLIYPSQIPIFFCQDCFVHADSTMFANSFMVICHYSSVRTSPKCPDTCRSPIKQMFANANDFITLFCSNFAVSRCSLAGQGVFNKMSENIKLYFPLVLLPACVCERVQHRSPGTFNEAQ